MSRAFPVAGWCVALVALGAGASLACSSSSSGSSGDGGSSDDASSSSSGAGSSSGGSSGATSSSGGSSSSGGTSGSSGSSGSSSGGSSSGSGGGTCGSPLTDASATCNSLTQAASATMVTPTCGSGMAPTLTGGTVVDGTYVLTSAVDYECEGGVSTAPAVKATAQFAGGCLQLVLTGAFATPDAGTQEVTYTGSTAVSFSGNTFMSTPQCPQAQPAVTGQTYTATATTLTYLSAQGYLQVFTKQ
ncbi:MAG: hypothetical protein ACRENE_33095 [Polyangiaceae bacterium]